MQHGPDRRGPAHGAGLKLRATGVTSAALPAAAAVRGAGDAVGVQVSRRLVQGTWMVGLLRPASFATCLGLGLEIDDEATGTAPVRLGKSP